MIKKTTLGFDKTADLGFLGNTLLHKVYLATYICIILFVILSIILYKTKFGLRLRALRLRLRRCGLLRCALRRALLHHGQHGVPYPELGALVSHSIAGRPDVQPQGVGAQRCPGIQLGAPPAQSLQSAA